MTKFNYSRYGYTWICLAGKCFLHPATINGDWLRLWLQAVEWDPNGKRRQKVSFNGTKWVVFKSAAQKEEFGYEIIRIRRIK